MKQEQEEGQKRRKMTYVKPCRSLVWRPSQQQVCVLVLSSQQKEHRAQPQEELQLIPLSTPHNTDGSKEKAQLKINLAISLSI